MSQDLIIPKRKILPPVYFLGALISMFALDRLMPIAEAIHAPYNTAGLVAVVLGTALFLWAATGFKQSRITIRPFHDTPRLHIDGPYRFTRNPMYLGLVLVLIGSNIMFGSLSPVFIIPLFWLVIDRHFVNHEERFLMKVRRWI